MQKLTLLRNQYLDNFLKVKIEELGFEMAGRM